MAEPVRKKREVKVNPLKVTAAMDHRQAIGARLKFFRENEGLTTSELGAAVEIDRTMVSKLEAGKHGMPDSIPMYFRTKYNMSYEWWFHGTGRRKTVGDEKKSILTDITNIYEKQAATTYKVDMIEKHLFNLLKDNKDLHAQINELKLVIGTQTGHTFTKNQ